jgi:hypothetical protein
MRNFSPLYIPYLVGGNPATPVARPGPRLACLKGTRGCGDAREMNMEFIYMKPALKMPAYEEIVPKRGCPTLLSRTSAMIFRIFP